MKNLAIALAAISVVFGAQAATVEWSSGDLNDVVTSPISSATDITAYYYVINAATYAELASTPSQDIYNQYIHSDGSGKAAANKTVEATEMWDGAVVADFTQEVDSTPAYIVAIYTATGSDNNDYFLASVAKYDPTTSGDQIYEDSDDYAARTSIAVTAYNKASSSWTAVPEPTTVALLALGIAAVGLKRKVA